MDIFRYIILDARLIFKICETLQNRFYVVCEGRAGDIKPKLEIDALTHERTSQDTDIWRKRPKIQSKDDSCMNMILAIQMLLNWPEFSESAHFSATKTTEQVFWTFGWLNSQGVELSGIPIPIPRDF
jgi:hypothetical protein